MLENYYLAVKDAERQAREEAELAAFKGQEE